MKRIRAHVVNGVAASLCRGAPAPLPIPARRHSDVPITLWFARMAFGVSTLLVIAIPTWCRADVTKLPAEDRKALLDASRFHDLHSIRDLPPAVVALCVDEKGKLADPGQSWNATDVTTDPTLPWKRLIWAAIGGDYYVVHYERGQIDHSFHILVAKLPKNDAKPTVEWHAVGHPIKDYTAFLDALRNGQLDDRLNYPR